MADWEIKPNGDNIDAVHRITKEVFSGTYAAFNAKTAIAPTYYKDSTSRTLDRGDLDRMLSSESATDVVFTIPLENTFGASLELGTPIAAMHTGVGKVSFAAAGGVTLVGTPKVSSADGPPIGIFRKGVNLWAHL